LTLDGEDAVWASLSPEFGRLQRQDREESARVLSNMALSKRGKGIFNLKFYRLNPDFGLRSWDQTPKYGVAVKLKGAELVADEAFNALSLCNGIMDTENFLVPERFRKLISFFEKRGVVSECKEREVLDEWQEHKHYNCRRISSAHWSVTGKCNLRCRHCYMSAPEAKYGEFTYEQCLETIDKISEAGIFNIDITGGEPFVRKDFFELVDVILSKNIGISTIYTNGFALGEATLDEFLKRKIKPLFSLSFDGIGYHDWLRGVPGAEEKTVKAIKLLRERGFRVSVESAFHRGSIHTIKDTMHLLSRIGVGHWKTNPASNSGNWRNEGRSLDLTIEELYDAYLDLIDEYFKTESPITVMMGGFFYCRKGLCEWFSPAKKHGGENEPLCLSARNTLYIAADGKLLPCIPLAGLPIQDEMPNILDTKLTEVLSNSEYLNRIETPVSALLEHNAECRECEHRAVCGGGCRAAALIENEDLDYLGKDPATCLYFKGGYEAKIKAVVEKYS
jgi:radical SAM protein with 4Fe4S-binding SPASM domain